ncbi:MAG: transcriptional repressor LexA [Oscillospiraceae bacterium]|nr:transcriptional repressor LexA [Oscillospiraceae bacterium]
MKKLTKMQQQVYDFIVRTIREQGYAPSVREIGEALGLKSPSTVHFHVKHLQELGLIDKGAGKGRAIALKQDAAPAVETAPVRVAPREESELPRRQVPILGNVAAGSPILAQECIEDYLTFDTGGHDEEYFALRVRGESMLGLGILPGDLVVVHRQQVAHNGEIVVALLEDEATVKTFSRKDGKIWLLPANPDYQPIDGTGCTILGRVVAVVRQY